jgi:hypothetical protein
MSEAVERYAERRVEEDRCKTIKRMLGKGKTPEEISDFCGYDLQYVKKVQEGIEGLTGNYSEDKTSGRKLGPLAGGLAFMADDFDETPNCFKSLTKKDITEELAESRMCYQNGGGEDFEKALDEIGTKHGL